MSFSGYYILETIRAHRDPQTSEEVIEPARVIAVPFISPKDKSEKVVMKDVPAVMATVTRQDVVTRVDVTGRIVQKIENGACVGYYSESGDVLSVGAAMPKGITEARVVGELLEKAPWE